MSTKEPTPWELVTDENYFRGVMLSMVDLGFGPKKNGQAHVRFGLTGIGYAPNYQIEVPDGTKHCFLGIGHGIADLDGDYDPNKLSSVQFTYKDVEGMLGRVIKQKG